jgi:hypothetical protein
MTDKPAKADDDDDDDGRGCLLIIGLIIVSIAFGNIFSAEVGWIILGLSLIAWAVLSR